MPRRDEVMMSTCCLAQDTLIRCHTSFFSFLIILSNTLLFIYYYLCLSFGISVVFLSLIPARSAPRLRSCLASLRLALGLLPPALDPAPLPASLLKIDGPSLKLVQVTRTR